MKSKTGYDKFFKDVKKGSATTAAAPIKIQQKPQTSVSASQIRDNMNQRKLNKTSRKFPAAQFVIFILCAAGLFLAIENFDKIESTLQKIEIGLGAAHAQTDTSATTTSSDANLQGASAANPVAATAEASGTIKAEIESDDADYIYKLAERKKVLDAREEELNKKAAEIDAQKIAVEKKLAELEEYRTKISTMLQDRIKSDDAKIETLVQVYTNMKPAQAAKIFESMDEDLVIDILTRMKKKSAAEILNLIKTEKAQAFAERYAGYRMPTSLPKPEEANGEMNEATANTEGGK